MSDLGDTLARAFDRIEDFEAVQAGARGSELVEAVKLLQESVGFDDEARALICERLESRPRASVGDVVFGLIVGLIAAELDAERRTVAA
jgi:hypothetical protein